MKVYRDLYDQVTSFESLWLAQHKAARGKRGQPAVAAFEFDLEDELLRLQDELISETYRPGPYTSFYIHDPKHRLISAAPFRDRVVHHATILELTGASYRSEAAKQRNGGRVDAGGEASAKEART